MRTCLILLMLAGASLAQTKLAPSITQVSKNEAPITLREIESSVLTTPSFYYSGISQCDADGNLYFNTARNFTDGIIMKLRHDGSYSLYVLPSDDPRDNYFVAYRVNAEGIVYLLAHAGLHDKLYLYEFSSDSKPPVRMELDIPAGLEPINFVVLPGGHVLLQGYFTDEAAPANRGQSYLAHYNPSGILLRDLRDKGSDVVASDVKSHNWTLTAAAVVAANGQSYMLSGNDILVLSPADDLINTIHVTLPDKNFRAVNLYIAGSRILVSYFKQSEKEFAFAATYALFDSTTGELQHTYLPTENMGNVLACFSKEGFTFMRAEKRHIKLIQANP